MSMFEHRFAYSRNFAKSFVADATKFRNAGLPTDGVIRIKSIVANKRNSETTQTRFGHLLLPQVVPISFSKADPKQCLFKKVEVAFAALCLTDAIPRRPRSSY